MADLTGMMQAAAGAAGEEPIYIEDVFSTWLYTGNGSTQTITNGIDLDGEGGLTWIKSRSNARNHVLFDTLRGATQRLFSNLTSAQSVDAQSLTAFNSNGFSVGSDSDTNANTYTYASWTFRKAEKFFDVVTYTGTGSARTVSHNLGSVPGCIIVKRTDSTGDWIVYHRANTANPETDYLELNDTAATADDNTMWNDTAPTSTVFTVGTDNDVNASAATYVAYLFAHDAGGFGDNGSENVISCGSYTGTGAAGNFVSVGYEPQLVLIKRSDATQDWFLFDNMRGLATGTGGDFYLNPNLSDAEGASGTYVAANATGFTLEGATTGFNASGGTYIYIAIRRGPMKTPTTGTEVFAPVIYAGNGTTQNITSGFANDMQIIRRRASAENNVIEDKLRGKEVLLTNTTDAGLASTGDVTGYLNTGFTLGASNQGSTNDGGSPSYISWNFLRAPGFFDVVCYTGTGSLRTVSHNLGVVPELLIVKRRDVVEDWNVYNATTGNAAYLRLNTTAAVGTAGADALWGSTTPTSSAFTVKTSGGTNASGGTFVAYLFASLAGVSKVGTYTGNGSSVTVTTGFQPRFILVKRTDSTGNWIVGDSARGLIAGNDPFLLLNSTAIETTNQDWVDVSATGFTVNETAANACVNNATYIYLAIS